MDYKRKYLKYKLKYENLQQMMNGGGDGETIRQYLETKNVDFNSDFDQILIKGTKWNDIANMEFSNDNQKGIVIDKLKKYFDPETITDVNETSIKDILIKKKLI